MPTFLDAIRLRLGAFTAIFQPSTMSADVTISAPTKSGTMLVDADWAAPGAIGATTRNTIKATTLTVGSTPKETRSATVPTSPSTGELWLELDGLNNPLYGWWWRWNGTYWLSPDFLIENSASNIAGQLANYTFTKQSFNYYFKSLSTAAYASATQTANNQWLFVVSRVTAANAPSAIATVPVVGASNGWILAVTNISLHVNVTSTATTEFSVVYNPVGVAGNLYAASQLLYNYARP